MKKLNLLSLLPVILFPLLIAGNAHAARPYSGFLPAAVNNKSGNIFWCDAHRQKWIQWDGLLLFARNLPEIVRVAYGGGSLPVKTV